jgi:hypothetical protein
MQFLSKSHTFFIEIERLILKFTWKCKEPRRVNVIYKNTVRRIILPDFKTHYKATVMKTVWYWHKGKHIDPNNRTESLEINLYTFSQSVVYKGGRLFDIEIIIFSTNGTGIIFNIWQMQKKMHLDTFFTLSTKKSSDELNLKDENKKLSEENM